MPNNAIQNFAKKNCRSRSYEEVKQICKRSGWRNKGQFQMQSSLYEQARYKGYLPQLESELGWKPNRKLDKKTCASSAARFHNRAAFKAGDQGAYRTSLVQGWLDEVCAHMKNVRGRDLTYELCAKLSRSTQTRSDLRDLDASVYRKIHDKGWFELFDHMTLQGDYTNRVVYEIRWKRSIYVGQTSNIILRKRRHLQNPRIRKLFENGAKIKTVSKVLPIDRALALERKLINKYRSSGWKVLNRTDGGDPGGGTRFWTSARLRKTCLKFRSKAHMNSDKIGGRALQAIYAAVARKPPKERTTYWQNVAPHFTNHKNTLELLKSRSSQGSLVQRAK